MAWNCNGSSVAPLTDYMDNPIFRELPDEEEFRPEKQRKNISRFKGILRICKRGRKLERNDSKINLMITLKKAAQFNMRVRIWAYSLSEYLNVLAESGLTLKHRTYAINQSDDDFLE